MFDIADSGKINDYLMNLVTTGFLNTEATTKIRANVLKAQDAAPANSVVQFLVNNKNKSVVVYLGTRLG
ncbi:hypothetical protein ACGFX8_37945 [Streptomyces sp. NPDC048362]|uniref:hypothetical protein n=1 Tax=Streptomyces sp. NPDC048362 TaxID=3365539 RepID=UPI0037133ADC